MTEVLDLLVEIGTEELPPKALKDLSECFGQGIHAGLEKAELTPARIATYATPRRLAVRVKDLAVLQPERQSLRRGPAWSAAFGPEGKPLPAAVGFAKSCGVAVDALEKLETAQGIWLCFRATERGHPTEELIPDIVRDALARLPIPKRMRWGTGDDEFVRPVHWVVLLFGSKVIDATILGIRSDRTTRGHRFHHPDPISLADPASYARVLQTTGFVLPQLEERREVIRAQVEAQARALGANAVIDPELLDEVTALTEWPVAISGAFDPTFLDLPSEVLVATLKDHQRCFHVVGPDGRLLAHFIAVANVESRNLATVRRGNERVVLPRLTDAAFFWDQDRRRPLHARRELLRDVVFQKQLGTLYDKSERLADLAAEIAAAIGADPERARRAGRLSKCDLMTDLVAEFPELQGVMGRYYAAHDGEAEDVAAALDEHYLPRFAGDRLPGTKTGQALAIADKLDTLVGVFGIGQAPSGDKDPFGLRRAALGVLRIIIERRLDLDLDELLNRAATGYGGMFDRTVVAPRVFDFMMERLRGYSLDDSVTPDVFDAVLARRPTRPVDFSQRLRAVTEFRKLSEADSLAAANKRIANILKQADASVPQIVDESLLMDAAERELAAALIEVKAVVGPMLRERDYTGVLLALAGLGDGVDRFFDRVLVLCEDRRLRGNRLALLQDLNSLFLDVADISRLHG